MMHSEAFRVAIQRIRNTHYFDTVIRMAAEKILKLGFHRFTLHIFSLSDILKDNSNKNESQSVVILDKHCVRTVLED